MNEIFELIRDITNAGYKLTFEEDWGGNSQTITIESVSELPYKIYKWDSKNNVPSKEFEMVSSTHTHTGFPDCKPEQGQEQFVRALRGFLADINERKKENETEQKR